MQGYGCQQQLWASVQNIPILLKIYVSVASANATYQARTPQFGMFSQTSKSQVFADERARRVPDDISYHISHISLVLKEKLRCKSLA